MGLSVRRVEDEKRGVGELHGPLVVTHFPGQHHLGVFGQILADPARVEKRRRHLVASAANCDAAIFLLRVPIHLLRHRIRDDVDDGDVLTLFRPLVVEAPAGRAFGVAARVVPEQVVDGADAELLVEQCHHLAAQDVVQPVGQRRHGYSTPISRTSPRWQVRYVISSVPGWLSCTWPCRMSPTELEASSSMPAPISTVTRSPPDASSRSSSPIAAPATSAATMSTSSPAMPRPSPGWQRPAHVNALSVAMRTDPHRAAPAARAMGKPASTACLSASCTASAARPCTIDPVGVGTTSIPHPMAAVQPATNSSAAT